MDCYAMDVLIRECNGRGDVGMNTHCEQMEWLLRPGLLGGRTDRRTEDYAGA